MGGLRGGDGPEPRVRGAPHVGLLNEIVPSGSPLGAGMDYCLAFSGERAGWPAGGRAAGWRAPEWGISHTVGRRRYEAEGII